MHQIIHQASILAATTLEYGVGLINCTLCPTADILHVLLIFFLDVLDLQTPPAQQHAGRYALGPTASIYHCNVARSLQAAPK